MQGHACLPGGGGEKLTSIEDAHFAKKNIDSNFNINFSLHAITSHFEVYGTNDGCQWKGNLGYSEEHSNRWAKLKLQCENNGWHQFLRQEEMVSHLLQCPKQQTYCSHCGGSITREWLQRHITSWCFHKLTSCPLGCKMILPQCVLLMHRTIWPFYCITLLSRTRSKGRVVCEGWLRIRACPLISILSMSGQVLTLRFTSGFRVKTEN